MVRYGTKFLGFFSGKLSFSHMCLHKKKTTNYCMMQLVCLYHGIVNGKFLLHNKDKFSSNH